MQKSVRPPAGSGLLALLLGLALAAVVGAADPELPNGPVYTPIEHQPNFRDERVLFGYSPAFQPNVITFDRRDRPYIRTEDLVVQTLDEDGNWLLLDMKPTLRAAYPDWSGSVMHGAFADERIVFAADDLAYTHVLLDRRTPAPRSLLLVSRDHCRTWTIVELPMPEAMTRLACSDSFRPLAGPPPITMARGNSLFLYVPQWSGDRLTVGDPILVSDACFAMGVPHSGGGNYVIRAADRIFAVYAGTEPVPDRQGTPQWIAEIRAGAVVARHLLGANGVGKPDGHNLPTLTADDDGCLHVLLGSHHDPFVYLRGRTPLAVDDWADPVTIGYPKTRMGEGSYTYIGLLHDPMTRQLHVVARWAGAGYYNRLVYYRRTPDCRWEEQQTLVQPFKPLYGVWYHKMTMDRHGRLFVHYRYLGSEFTLAEARDRMDRYPDEPLPLPADAAERVNGMSFFRDSGPHGYCLLMSDDQGATWRLATTADLRAGVTPPLTPSDAPPEIANSLGQAFRLVQPGTFFMGSVTDSPDERPCHRVVISRPYYLATTETRVRDFRRFVAATGYRTLIERTPADTWYGWLDGTFRQLPDASWRNPGYEQTDDHPVTLLVREDIEAFIAWLSAAEGHPYRLPTEAEWEYACRAGTTTPWSTGDDPTAVPAVAWCRLNCTQAQPVGLKPANPWGFHDIHGNLWEMVADWYRPTYPAGVAVDPVQAEPTRSGPVIRGGGWIDDVHDDRQVWNLRSAARYHVVYPRIQLNWLGFRLARDLD